MIISACVRFYTKPVNKTDPIESIMYDIPCHRHADAFYIISQFMDASEIDQTRTEQGFLTHEDQFLNRYDAMQHAIACGQLIPPNTDKELYSEDLW